MTYIVAVLVVVGMAVGQLLFKLSATSLKDTGSFFDPRTAFLLVLALSLYGLMTIAWIWVLQKADLGRVYPIMALAFALVPIGSHLFFGERFGLQYFVGIFFIIIGIVVAVKA